MIDKTNFFLLQYHSAPSHCLLSTVRLGWDPSLLPGPWLEWLDGRWWNKTQLTRFLHWRIILPRSIWAFLTDKKCDDRQHEDYCWPVRYYYVEMIWWWCWWRWWGLVWSMKCSPLTSVCLASHVLSLIATLALSPPVLINNINIILLVCWTHNSDLTLSLI